MKELPSVTPATSSGAAAMPGMKEERCVCVSVCLCMHVLCMAFYTSSPCSHITPFVSLFSIFSDVGQYVFDPKSTTSSQATRGNYFEQPTGEKEVTAKGKRQRPGNFI